MGPLIAVLAVPAPSSAGVRVGGSLLLRRSRVVRYTTATLLLHCCYTLLTATTRSQSARFCCGSTSRTGRDMSTSSRNGRRFRRGRARWLAGRAVSV